MSSLPRGLINRKAHYGHGNNLSHTYKHNCILLPFTPKERQKIMTGNESWMGPVAAAGITFAGGERSNKAMAEQASRQMDFQEAMSNTAYQRSMADMKKAGLNPILAAKLGGASTPPGAMANIQDTLGPAVTSAQQQQKTTADVNLTKAKEAVTKTENTLKKSLVPGANTLKIFTENAHELIKAADDLIREYRPEYKDVLNLMSDAISALFKKSQPMAKSLPEKQRQQKSVQQWNNQWKKLQLKTSKDKN